MSWAGPLLKAKRKKKSTVRDLCVKMSWSLTRISARRAWTLSHMAKGNAFASGSEVVLSRRRRAVLGNLLTPRENQPWSQRIRLLSRKPVSRSFQAAWG